MYAHLNHFNVSLRPRFFSLTKNKSILINAKYWNNCYLCCAVTNHAQKPKESREKLSAMNVKTALQFQTVHINHSAL